MEWKNYTNKHQYGGITLGYFGLLPFVTDAWGKYHPWRARAATQEYVIFLGKRYVQAKVYFKSGSPTSSPWVSKHALGHDQAKGRDKSWNFCSHLPTTLLLSHWELVCSLDLLIPIFTLVSFVLSPRVFLRVLRFSFYPNTNISNSNSIRCAFLIRKPCILKPCWRNT